MKSWIYKNPGWDMKEFESGNKATGYRRKDGLFSALSDMVRILLKQPWKVIKFRTPNANYQIQ